jgi:hypothetical protein
MLHILNPGGQRRAAIKMKLVGRALSGLKERSSPKDTNPDITLFNAASPMKQDSA